MAANKILDGVSSLFNFAQDGFKYNLQVFPDTVTAAAILFSLLFQSPSLAAFSVSVVLLNFIHPVLSSFLSSMLNETVGVGNTSRCTGRFPGVSIDRISQLATSSGFGALSDNAWPSYYTTFLGFLSGYIGALPVIYQKELSASPTRRSAVIFGEILIVLLLVIGSVYRVFSGCDTPIGVFAGLVSGAVVGLSLVAFIAWISERRLTNILSFPLLRDKAADGKPIYVCERPLK